MPFTDQRLSYGDSAGSCAEPIEDRYAMCSTDQVEAWSDEVSFSFEALRATLSSCGNCRQQETYQTKYV